MTQNALRDLPGTLTELIHLETLLANNNVFKTIPIAVFQLKSLVQLFFNLNPIREVSSALGNLENLEWLDLSECGKLSVLPDSISNLTRLKRLDVHSCCLQEVPDTIAKLKRLDRLSLHFNGLTHLTPAIGECTALTWLSLNANKLQSLPAELGKLTNLIRLSVHINELERIPEEIGNLIHLEAISLHSNRLTDLPKTLHRLTECGRLSLYQNPHLRHVDPSIGGMVSLVELWAYDCAIEEIPREFGRLQNLQKLWLSDNSITRVPCELAQCTSLKELYLENNLGLVELPEELLQRQEGDGASKGVLKIFLDGTPAFSRLNPTPNGPGAPSSVIGGLPYR